MICDAVCIVVDQLTEINALCYCLYCTVSLILIHSIAFVFEAPNRYKTVDLNQICNNFDSFVLPVLLLSFQCASGNEWIIQKNYITFLSIFYVRIFIPLTRILKYFYSLFSQRFIWTVSFCSNSNCYEPDINIWTHFTYWHSYVYLYLHLSICVCKGCSNIISPRLSYGRNRDQTIDNCAKIKLNLDI